MSRTNSAFDIRAEHPKRVHIDREMKEIRVKKTARDQLPDLESDGTVELRYKKVANRPEREASQETRPDTASKTKTAAFTTISNLVRRAINEATRPCLHSNEDHEGSRWTQCYGDLVYHNNAELAPGEERNKLFAVSASLAVIGKTLLRSHHGGSVKRFPETLAW
jgi:hypothetical protein